MNRTLFTIVVSVAFLTTVLEAKSCIPPRGSNKRAVLAGGYAWTVSGGNLLKMDKSRGLVERVEIMSDVLVERRHRLSVSEAVSTRPRIDGASNPHVMYWTSQNTPIAGNYIREIHIDSNQRFVAVTDTALSVFDGTSWETISPCGHHSGRKHRILDSFAAKEGLFVLTDCGLWHYNNHYGKRNVFQPTNTSCTLSYGRFFVDGLGVTLTFTYGSYNVTAIFHRESKILTIHEMTYFSSTGGSYQRVMPDFVSEVGLCGIHPEKILFKLEGADTKSEFYQSWYRQFDADSLHTAMVGMIDVPDRYSRQDVELHNQPLRLPLYDVAVDRVVADAHGTLFLLTTRGVIVVPNAGRTIALDDNGTPELIPFPNPASVDTELRLEESDIGGELTIINSMGTVVARENVTSATMRIVTSGLPAGQYGLVTTTQRSRRMGRLVVMR
ncbi:MAG TPA: hypothetical protein DIS79_00220 [Bacteroidetes bacterium]|nr:hypothetical protein [Bacteroidota bacterium]HRK04602.1 T9SS type A sorting domain-containing protein [Chlorobiota bacterium]